MSKIIYKIVSSPIWEQAEGRGEFSGAGIDLTDGYIHFSTAETVAETASRYFAGQTDLLLVSVATDRLDPENLRWEPARGGVLFPHLYSALPLTAVVAVDALPWDEAQGHRFPEGVVD